LARTVKQSRQFITNGHISVNGKKCNIPSYLVLKDEEGKVSFNLNSKLSNENHPERFKKALEELKEEKKHVKEEIEGGKKESLVEVSAV
jgi:small subunit ribosomal protein S4